MNIKIKLSAYGFKTNISNLHFDLNICYNFSTNIILAFCLASFNCHLNRNINLSTQLLAQILTINLFKTAL